MKKIRKGNNLKEIVLIVAMICVAIGVFLFLRKPVTEELRQEKEKLIVDDIASGTETIIVKRNEYVIEGEGLENINEDTAEPTSAEEEQSLPEEVTLTAAGTIQAEKIDLNIPLWDDAGLVPLRYGAGILSGSSFPGEGGNMVVLGHRMKTYGSLFNRLGEIEIGDEVKTETTDGDVYIYVVDEILSAVDPKELPLYISPININEYRLTLVTCTPTGVGTHRLIIIAHLKGQPC